MEIYDGKVGCWWRRAGGSGRGCPLPPLARPTTSPTYLASLPRTTLTHPHPPPHTPIQQPELWNVEAKSDESPVTAADTAANAVICHGLAKIGVCGGWGGVAGGWGAGTVQYCG